MQNNSDKYNLLCLFSEMWESSENERYDMVLYIWIKSYLRRYSKTIECEILKITRQLSVYKSDI